MIVDNNNGGFLRCASFTSGSCTIAILKVTNETTDLFAGAFLEDGTTKINLTSNFNVAFSNGNYHMCSSCTTVLSKNKGFCTSDTNAVAVLNTKEIIECNTSTYITTSGCSTSTFTNCETGSGYRVKSDIRFTAPTALIQCDCSVNTTNRLLANAPFA